MDPALLTDSGFWDDPQPTTMGAFPGPLPQDDRLSHTVLFESSGSSGTPKWVVLSKSALNVSAAAVNRHLHVTRDSCWGLALPVHHVGGFGVGARAFVAGCRLEVFHGKWEAGRFTGWLVHSQITHTTLVPTQVHDLVTAGLRAPALLEAIVVGGGQLDSTTGRAARALGWPLLASYGMTEAASQIATQPLSALHSIYQPSPLPLLPIWKAELTGDGLLQIAGPALFSGLLVPDGGGWIHVPRAGDWHLTSDLAMLDPAGLTPVGRIDLFAKVLGELVDPESIERELSALSGGRLKSGSFAVIAVPDPRAGHRLIPVFESSVEKSGALAVLAEYARNCPGFRRLRDPEFIDAIPKSALGKVMRAQLSATYADSGARP